MVDCYSRDLMTWFRPAELILTGLLKPAKVLLFLQTRLHFKSFHFVFCSHRSINVFIFQGNGSFLSLIFEIQRHSQIRKAFYIQWTNSDSWYYKMTSKHTYYYAISVYRLCHILSIVMTWKLFSSYSKKALMFCDQKR